MTNDSLSRSAGNPVDIIAKPNTTNTPESFPKSSSTTSQSAPTPNAEKPADPLPANASISSTTAPKPSSKPPSPPIPVAAAATTTSRTKTFTGCWTCRSRKIKCDLRRPTCFRCEKANLECAGYSIKLRWSPSNAKGETGETIPNNNSGEEDFFQRRNVEFVQYPPHMVYEYYEDMDLILSKLHSPKIQGNETKVLGPFGVFQGVKTLKRRMPNLKKSKRRKTTPEPRTVSAKSSAAMSPISSNSSPSLQPLSPKEPFQPAIRSPLVTFVMQNDDNDEISTHDLNGINLGTITELDNIFNTNNNDANLQNSNINSINNNNNSTNNDSINSNISNGGSHANQPSIDDNSIFLDTVNDVDFTLEKNNFDFNASLSHQDHAFSTFDNHHPDVNIDIILNNDDILHHQKQIESSHTHNKFAPVVDHTSNENSDLFMSLSGPNVSYYLSHDMGLGLPTNSLYFLPQSRYLLNHYIRNVARVMTVVTHEKTAWKTIYLPRALSAIGELVGLGSCSSPRRALLHALLSISSFHLASKLPENSDQKNHYMSLGVSLKNQALQHLHTCLQTESLATVKHKDIMTAMLSMVTIDVVSGEMKECRLHLQGCKHLVNKRRESGRPISKKALVLHRISSFLCLMQNATTLNPTLMDPSVIDDKSWDDFAEIAELGLSSPDAYTRNFNPKSNENGFQDPGSAVSSSSTPKSNGLQDLESLSYIQSESQLREYWNRYSNDLPQKIETFYDNELESTHSMYCIPDSLTLLFSRTVKLARQVCYMRWKKLPITKATVEKCNFLQGSLRQWGLWYNESRLPAEFTADARIAADHHTNAFYYALLIYHYTNVREVNPASLQGFVSTVLEKLNQLLALNRDKSNPLIIPLLFPVFVAACEALSKDMQNRFDDFFDRLSIQGLGTYYQARMVVKEVWKRRDNNQERSAWRHVLQDQNVNIMLS